MCTVLLPPGGNPIAVNKYITYIISNNFGNNYEEKEKEEEGRSIYANDQTSL
jgi:hypothetical protein